MFDRDTCFSLLGKSSTMIRPGVVQCHVQFEPPVGKITRIVLVSNDVVLTVYLQYSISAGKRCLVSGTTSTSRQ
jgi:hypothetical protein